MKTQTSYKACTRCGSRHGVQPLEAFDKDSRTLDGRRSVCKNCRQEERFAKINTPITTPSNGSSPSRRYAKKISANTSPRKPIMVLKNIATVFWLVVLFCGGFILSVINGMFALIDTAQLVALGHVKVVAAAAAGVLTLGTSIAASSSARLYLARKAVPALILLAIFVCMQTLNLFINYTGVQKRFMAIRQKQISVKQEQNLQAIQTAKVEYQKVIDRYPPVNHSGNPVVWKSEITKMVKTAQDEINRLNRDILVVQRRDFHAGVRFNWQITTAWLVLPELSMLLAIVVFSFVLSPGNFGNFSIKGNHTEYV